MNDEVTMDDWASAMAEQQSATDAPPEGEAAAAPAEAAGGAQPAAGLF